MAMMLHIYRYIWYTASKHKAQHAIMFPLLHLHTYLQVIPKLSDQSFNSLRYIYSQRPADFPHDSYLPQRMG